MSNEVKTYKRELATALVALYVFAWGYTLHALATRPEANHDAMVSLLNATAPFIAGLAAGAFGADTFAKQIKGRHS